MHPILDSVNYKWAEPKAAELYKLLRKAFPDAQKKEADTLYQMSGTDLPELNRNQQNADFWKDLLENLAANSCLRRFCELIQDRGKPKPLMDVLKGIFEMQAVAQLKVIDNASVFDRMNLRNKLEALADPGSNIRVLIVRGEKQSGKSHGRLLFLSVAKENQGTPVLLKKGQVNVLEDVLLALFTHIGGLTQKAADCIADMNKNKTPDTTDNACLKILCDEFLKGVLEKKVNLWIAMDNLGKEGDAFLLPEEIKLFFDQLVLKLSSLSYLDHVRLMLIDYPEGDTPPGWEELMWQEDRTSHTDVDVTHVIEVIEFWCLKKKKQVHKDEIIEKAKSIVKEAEELVKNCSKENPAYRIKAIDQYVKNYVQTL
jgi:hypothetical protein